MYEQVFDDLFRIEVPIPNNPLKALNAYLIKGADRNLLIDTGMNRKECLEPMQSALKALNIDLSRTDFFITHIHADHLGLVDTLKTETSLVYLGALEASLFNTLIHQVEARQKKFTALLASHGFPQEELEMALSRHPGYRYIPKGAIDFTGIKDGDTLRVGDYTLTCIETPGHSPSHMCLYEADKKILFSGDHILSTITPNITTWPGFGDTLSDYLKSLDKVYDLDVNFVLPGHRSPFSDHRKRIRELKAHHATRLVEAIDALGKGAKTAWEVAPHIAWDLKAKSWDEFPPAQKWFAVGETIAHLNHLVAKEKIRRIDVNERIIFELNS